MSSVIVAAVIAQGGRFLLARRAQHKPDAGVWEFPGGKVELGETWPAALVRELHEEMRIDVEVGAKLYEALPFVAYEVTIVGGEPCLQDHDRIDWVAPGEFTGYRMHAFDEAVAGLLT